MPDRSLTPPLDEYLRQIETLAQEARNLAADLDHEAFNWSESGKWSIGQCLDHMASVNGAYLRSLDAEIPQARSAGLTGDGGARYGWFERWFIRSLEPPPKWRFKAPSKAAPQGSDLDPQATLDRYLGSNQRLQEQLAAADGLNLVKVMITSPLASFFKFRLGAVFALLIAHDRRHLWQARQVRNASGFPASGN